LQLYNVKAEQINTIQYNTSGLHNKGSSNRVITNESLKWRQHDMMWLILYW